MLDSDSEAVLDPARFDEDELPPLLDACRLTAHPTAALLAAHPSMGCAYPCAPVVLGAQTS
jgi:hypothetical protein